MLSRKTLLALGLAGAVGVPLATDSSSEIIDSISGKVGAWMGKDEEKKDVAAPTSEEPSQSTGPLQARIDGVPPHHLGEIFSFDVTPAWIMSRWSRVSTQAGPPEFQGYRVPLLTGLKQGDLTGMLTYCFDDQQKLQRLTFRGTTDDPSRLVALATARFGFTASKAPTPGQQQYEIRWNGQTGSRLNIRMAGVIDTQVPNRRYSIDLEINLPNVAPSWHPAAVSRTGSAQPDHKAESTSPAEHK